MRIIPLAAAGLALAVFGMGTAQAAPVGLLKPVDSAADSALIKVHGVHSSCQLGGAGWHRSPRRGVRIVCRPARPRGIFWTWREFDGRKGWYHRRDRRWH